MSRLGILGGTFDPPHIGHLILAQYAHEAFYLGKVIFIPAAIQPHKTGKPVTSATARFEMLKLAVENNPGFTVSDIEQRRGGLSYTCDTLRRLKGLYPGDELYLILGGDNIADITTWKNPDEIFTLAKVVAAKRPEFDNTGVYSGRIQVFEMPLIGISSTLIRHRIMQGKTVSYLVPAAVEQYINRHRLYSR